MIEDDMAAAPMPEWLTVKQVAHLLGVSRGWVYGRIKRKAPGAPPSVRRGRVIRIPAEQFREWAKDEVIG